jgi:type IV secretory pathway VirB10-like protein
MILENSDVCAHCGQPLPGRGMTQYGERKPNRIGIIITILLHLLLVVLYLVQPKTERHSAPAKSGEAVVWLPPLPKSTPKARPVEQAPKKTAKVSPAPFERPRVANVRRLPNTITVPQEEPVIEKPTKPQPVKEDAKPIPQDMDMQAYIEARRRQRGARDPVPSEQTEESAASRGTRNALNNIASINGRGGQDPDDTGGVFSITNKSFNSADVKFRGWNQNFKRRWLTAVTVQRGSEPDIETAIVKKMIELIRKEKTGDFEWESHRLGRVVTMSARPQDEQQLVEFLYKEMFPDYQPPRR